MNELLNIDRTVFYFINRDCQNAVLDLLMPYITRMGGGIFILGLALVLLLAKDRNVKISGILLLAGQTLVYYVIYFIKQTVGRPRPYVVLPDVNLLVPTGGFSFPSHHSATAFMAAVVLASCFKKRWYVFYVAAALVALSRVYIGVHYPVDIIVGGCLGAILGYALVSLSKNAKNLP
jgi:undecaprenyl-diphosphatase